MSRIIRRAGYYLLFISVLIVVASVTYDVSMKMFEPGQYPPEDTQVSLLHSMQVVVETFTATGYGSDSPWASVEMNLLVMLLDITGVGLFFLALPAVLLPLFQEALSPTPPTDLDGSFEDHVVVCSDTSRADTLIDELESNGIEYVLVEPDRDRALALHNDGQQVLHADPESVAALDTADISAARALIADISDRVDASIVLAAREATEETEIVSVVEDPEREPYHRLAGADHVLTPRKLLGEALTRKLTTDIGTDLGDTVRIDEDFEIAELPIRRGSNLAGKTLAESDLREEYGVNVVGAWVRGDFETSMGPETELEQGTILLVAGGPDKLSKLTAVTSSPIRRPFRGEAVVVGYGKVGQTIESALADAGISCTVIDRRDDPGIDIVGDATDPESYQEANVERARSVVFALPDDTTTEFATLVVRDIDPTTEILARAERPDAVDKIYRAGADYVLSLAEVSGRSIATRVVEDDKILSVDTNVEIIRRSAPGLAGETLQSAAIRERTGCTVVAIERDGTVLTDLGPDSRIRPDDEVVVVGTGAGTNRFSEVFG